MGGGRTEHIQAAAHTSLHNEYLEHQPILVDILSPVSVGLWYGSTDVGCLRTRPTPDTVPVEHSEMAADFNCLERDRGITETPYLHITREGNVLQQSCQKT